MAHDELAGRNVHAAPAEPHATRTHGRRRSLLARGLAIAGALLAVLVLLAGWYVLSLRADYRATRAEIDAIQAMMPPAGSNQQLQISQLPELVSRLATVEAGIRRLDERMHVPVLTTLALHTPWLGERVRALEEFIAFGVNASSLAHDSALLGNDIYAAWQASGFSGPADPNAPTWLGTVQHNRASIDGLLLRFDLLLQERAQLRDDRLPGRATRILATLDPLLIRAETTRDRYVGLLDYYPIVEEVLGAREDGRYLVLLLNSQEIRPIGGFPGTYAIITLRDGRLADYEFHNMLELDGAYLEHRSEVVPSPAPLAEHLKVMQLLPRDTGWEPDFATSAQTLLEMYAVTGEPEIQGVVAVTDRAVRDVLRVLGPLTVTVQGEPVTVNAENVIETIEAYRLGLGEKHKAVVRVIGSALLDRIRNGGFDLQRDTLVSIRESADRREIQLYAVDPDLQAEVVAHGWDGALVPDPAVPTLGITLANVVGNKASHHLDVASEMTFSPQAGGVTRVTWEIAISHTGDPQGDIYYNGFLRTWLAVYLPQDSTLISSSPLPEPAMVNDDPRATAFHLPIDPGKSKRVRVTFDLPPNAQSLYLRRQAGANPLQITLSGGSAVCTIAGQITLERDAVIDLERCRVNGGG